MSAPANLEVTTAQRGNLFDPACPTRRLLDRLGTKWTSMTVLTLSAAHPDEIRFAELRRQVPGISQKMLAQTLLHLRRDGLVSRRVENTVPPSVYYALTDRGRTLTEPLDVLRHWAEENMAAVDDAGARFDRAHDGDVDSSQQDLRRT